MSHHLHVIDAFTDRPFAGNPAAVCLLRGPADAAWMQAVAREMNLSETAFLVPGGGAFGLRWFTPTVEVDLCGHATLASAHMLWETGALEAGEAARFDTRSGRLTCRRAGAWIEMDFPVAALSDAPAPSELAAALGVPALATRRTPFDWLVEVDGEATVRAVRPDLRRLAALPVRGVIVTARAATAGFDFVSRFFAPAAGVDEDPVTGSAHCALGPYWRELLGRADLVAAQVSARGGVVRVGVRGDRVLLGGQAVTVSRVELAVVAGPPAPPGRVS